MTRLKTALAAFSVLSWAAASPALADSSASSSASESVSTSVGSISDSFKKSSDSSSKTDVADGDYKIVQLAAADRPGMVRMTLQAVAGHGGDDDFALVLPQQVLEINNLVQGQTVTAQHRPYGVEFSRGEPRQAFFLVLADAWFRELQTRPVVL